MYVLMILLHVHGINGIKRHGYRYDLRICGMMKSYTITTFGIAEKIKNYILLLILQT